jgi:hypothetical protein
MEWILILVFTVHLGSSKGITTTTVDGFETEQQCKEAGSKTLGLADNTRFVCVKR